MMGFCLLGEVIARITEERAEEFIRREILLPCEMKVLPLLPEGSTYTGIDLDAGALEEANRIFEQKPWKRYFIIKSE